jgi:hypothetical protein
MLACYCDEAEETYTALRGGFTVVAGYTGTAQKWDGFEIDWKLLLAHYKVPYLHMRELAHWIGPYAKWKERPMVRNHFLRDASEIIRSKVQMGFTCFVWHLSFQRVNALYKLEECFSTPYALSGYLCMAIAEQWRAKGGKPEIKYVFEDGGIDKGGLVRGTTSILPHMPTPTFEAGKDWKPSRKWPQGRKGLVHLQAADYLAYENRKALTDRINKGIRPDRKSLKAIVAVPNRLNVNYM